MMFQGRNGYYYLPALSKSKIIQPKVKKMKKKKVKRVNISNVFSMEVSEGNRTILLIIRDSNKQGIFVAEVENNNILLDLATLFLQAYEESE